MSDPLIDKAAAEAFTKEWAAPLKDTIGRSRQLVCTWEPQKRPRCWCRQFGHPSAFQCGNPGKVTLADGSTWCGSHGPAAVARRAAAKAATEAKHAARHQQMLDSMDLQKRRRAAEAGARAALQAIADGDNDPRATARAALAAYPED